MEFSKKLNCHMIILKSNFIFWDLFWYDAWLSQFSHSVVSDSLWPMDCSMPGFPVLHDLPEFTQTHVHWISDAIQPSHPLLSPSSAFYFPQHQGLFQGVNSLHQVAKILEPGSNSQILCSWILTLLLLSKKSSVFIAITGFQLTSCLSLLSIS